jgi:flagellar hook-associated protein 2
MASSVDGLISGLSTSTLISQLMQAESAGQTKLKGRVSAEQKTITSFQNLNTRLATLQAASKTAMDATTWQAAKATSSSNSVTATASPGAASGQVTFDVKRLASANVQTAVVPSSGSIQDGSGLKITIGGTTTPVTVTTDTAQGVAEAINSAGLGVRAAVVSSEQGNILQLTATKTGASNAFTVSGLNVGMTEVAAGQDAQIGVGTVGAGGYTVTSASNTFSNLLPGVSLTASKVESGVTVSVASDVDALASKIQAMVDNANGLLTEIKGQTSVTKTSSGVVTGSLTGNSLARQIQSDLLSAASGGMNGYGSFKQLGVETSRDGLLKFDKAAFVAAYQADPAKTQNAVTEGLAKSLNTVADKLGDVVTDRIQSGNNTVRGLNDQVDKWDVRLKMREEALQKQFTSLEVSLGKMRDQSNWLAGQIASLG